jgi:hypothetical protein
MHVLRWFSRLSQPRQSFRFGGVSLGEPFIIPNLTCFRSGGRAQSTAFSNLTPRTRRGVVSSSSSSSISTCSLTFSFCAGSSGLPSSRQTLRNILGRPFTQWPSPGGRPHHPGTLQGQPGYGQEASTASSNKFYDHATRSLTSLRGHGSREGRHIGRDLSMRQGLAALVAPGPKGDQLPAAPSMAQHGSRRHYIPRSPQ